jgi:hypothetical protein
MVKKKALRKEAGAPSIDAAPGSRRFILRPPASAIGQMLYTLDGTNPRPYVPDLPWT